jgi:hypothetical protein
MACCQVKKRGLFETQVRIHSSFRESHPIETHGRSSDLLLFPGPSHSVEPFERTDLNSGESISETLHGAYSSGTVPDSHRIPF